MLDSFLANYSEQELAKNYQSCLPQVRQLLEPVALVPEDFIKAWQAVSYESFYPDFFCLNPNDGREIIWEHFA